MKKVLAFAAMSLLATSAFAGASKLSVSEEKVLAAAAAKYLPSLTNGEATLEECLVSKYDAYTCEYVVTFTGERASIEFKNPKYSETYELESIDFKALTAP
jgi:hypothetical protein